jgi:hypothetical protein
MQSYSAEEINQATAEARRLYRAMQQAYRACDRTDCTLAEERAAVTALLTAVHAYAAWLSQDTRPATAPSWTNGNRNCQRSTNYQPHQPADGPARVRGFVLPCTRHSLHRYRVDLVAP